jgi:hypothetical protein
MDEYSAKTYDNYREASQRFEYFVLGLCVAVVAYAGQTLQPEPFGLNSSTVETGAILLLIACVALGLKRVEKIIAFHGANLHVLEFKERRSALVKFVLEGGSRVNPETSELWQPGDMKKQIVEFDKIIPELEKKLNDLNDALARLYR